MSLKSNQTRRTQRAGEQVVRTLMRILLEDVQDPRVKGVTFLSCDMSPDLKNAKVYFSLIGDEQKIHNAHRALKHMTGYLQRLVAAELQIRYTPALTFIYDSSLDHGAKILSLLAELKDKKEPTDKSE